MNKHDLKRYSNGNVCNLGTSTYFLWRSWRTESAGADQEGIRKGFAILNLRMVTQNNVVEQAEEVFVLARLQLERRTG